MIEWKRDSKSNQGIGLGNYKRLVRRIRNENLVV
jgi:hypothetical protein